MLEEEKGWQTHFEQQFNKGGAKGKQRFVVSSLIGAFQLAECLHKHSCLTLKAPLGSKIGSYLNPYMSGEKTESQTRYMTCSG